MQKLFIPSTLTTPEISFSPEDNYFMIKGNSAPEDVRSLYYPVIEWIRIFVDDLLEGEYPKYNKENPLRFQTDLHYFNSSSAKFLFDIFNELKRLQTKEFPLVIDWNYESDDLDQKEAGIDIALLVEMEFNYIAHQKNN
jgi:hypothetical protein